MQLSELAQSSNIKALIYGDSGTGKTCLAAGFPGPIEIWDFDGKANSAGYYYRNDQERLKQIEVKQFHKLPIKNDADINQSRIAAFDTRCRELSKLHRENKPLPFKTLVLDSLTTFVQSILDDYILRSQTGIKRPIIGLNSQQDYGLLDRHLTQIITGILAMDCNVVVIGHVATEKDDVTGSISKKPFMAGKFADKLPIFFEEVYVSKINSTGQYVLQTNSDSYYKCRTQRGLPKEVQTNYQSIIKQY